MSMFSENTQSEYPCGEYGQCLSCGWMCEYPQSHIEYCGGGGCDYIRKKYDTWLNEDGEIEWKVKTHIKKVVKKRAVKKPLQITYSFNPIELMKKLPTDINIYINEFLYNKNGYNEGLVNQFNRILRGQTFLDKLNELYFDNIARQVVIDDSFMNEYEIAVRYELVKGGHYMRGCDIRFNNYITDDGKPIGRFYTDGADRDYELEIVNTDELVEKYVDYQFIHNNELLNKVDSDILHHYIYEKLSSYNKDCCAEPNQIRALQRSSNNYAYEVLVSYINMVGSEEQFYEWFVNYYTDEAFKLYYTDEDDGEDYGQPYFQEVRELDMGWSKCWLVIAN